MKELREAVINKIKTMTTDGSIEEMIDKELSKTLSYVIGQALQSYSTFGEDLGKRISESIGTSLDGMELPQYNTLICEMVEKQFIDVLSVEATKQLSDQIGKRIKPVTKDAKISTLLDLIKECYGDEAREQGLESIELDVEYNDDETAVIITFEKPGICPEKIRITLYNFHRGDRKTWHIGYLRFDEVTVSGYVKNASRSFCDEFETELMKYYLMKTEFEMDVEIESIYVANY